MAPSFGTSGLRGLVAELTPELVAAHVRAFLSVCDCGGCLCIGRDLRPSSTRIAADVIRATTAAGIEVVDCGALPTPALALAAALRGCGAVMITGSHIPADRNGLKFYTASGEITKSGETAIVRALGVSPPDAAPAIVPATVTSDREAGRRFVDRYLRAFGPSALAGRRIGHFAHSAVGRDLVGAILSGLGAEVVELDRSDDFVAVDTEAIETATSRRIAGWVADLGLDALVSTDGDSDRPLLADETGRIVPGDILGQIAAEMLGADTVVTPVSSGSGVTMKNFGRVIRTRIGSPYVIAAMNEAGGRVLGYEANGGLILGFAADGPAGPLGPLPTRDSILPLLTALVAAAGGPVSARVAAEPGGVTLSCRLPDIAPDRARFFVAELARDAKARAAFLGKAHAGCRQGGVDLTDGVRMTLADGRVIHVRPSGNAPEMRLYVEAGTRADAELLLAGASAALAEALG